MSFLASLGHLKGLFYNGLMIDDAVFKLHYGFTSYLLLGMTFILVGNVFISGQIYCSLSMYEFEKIISKEMLNSYCFIHSTYVVPKTDLYLDDSMYKYEGIGPYSQGDKGDIVFHSYYQWISLLLFIQGMMYYVSHLWWTQMENQTIKHLRMNLNDPALDKETKDAQLEKLTEYFIKYRGRHHLYGIRYFYVIVFNALHVLLDIIITHYILNRQFVTYGWNYSFSSKSNRLRIQDVIYWLYHMISPNYRLKHIERHLKGNVKGNKLKFLNKHFGDWFLLHQIHKNIDPTNFTELVSELCRIDDESVAKLRRSETFVAFNLPAEEETENK